jgi:hypothetical protein
MRHHIGLMRNKLGPQQVVVVARLPRLRICPDWRGKRLEVVVSDGH